MLHRVISSLCAAAWLTSGCATMPTITEKEIVSAPGQDALHEFFATAPEVGDEERAKARAARKARIADLETLYDSSTNEMTRANALYELTQLLHEEAFDLKDQAETAHAAAMDRFAIGEIAVEPTLKLEAYHNALLHRVNTLRDFVGKHPRDPRLAEVNWQIASTMARLGNEHCEHYFRQAALLAKTPEAANKVKLSRADWLASNKKWDEAVALYTEVREAITDKGDALRAYAHYRLGWAYREKGDKTKAEAAYKLAFLSLTEDQPRRLRLKREAERSLVALWAADEREADAKAFAEAHERPKLMDDYRAHVAYEWQKKGRFDDVIAYNQSEIAKDPFSKRVPDLRLKIAQARVAKGDIAGMQGEIAALNKMVSDSADPWFAEHGDDAALVARVKKMVTLLPLASSLRVFQQALAEKDQKKQKTMMTSAVAALREQRKAATAPEQDLTVRMSIIQGLILLEKLPEALDELDALVKLGPKAEPHLVEAAFERLRILVKLDEGQKYPDLPPPGEVRKPMPLPPLKMRFAAAAEDYLKLVPDADNKVNLSYQIAYDLFAYGHYDQALPLFEALAHEFPRTEQGKVAIEICLSMNLKRKNWTELARLSTDFLNNRQVRGKALRDYIKENLDWAKQQVSATAH